MSHINIEVQVSHILENWQRLQLQNGAVYATPYNAIYQLNTKIKIKNMGAEETSGESTRPRRTKATYSVHKLVTLGSLSSNSSN